MGRRRGRRRFFLRVCVRVCMVCGSGFGVERVGFGSRAYGSFPWV